MKTFKGYDFRLTQDGRVAIHPAGSGKVQYVAETLGEAKRWVVAYRDGVAWAIVEKLDQDALRAAVSP